MSIAIKQNQCKAKSLNSPWLLHHLILILKCIFSTFLTLILVVFLHQMDLKTQVYIDITATSYQHARVYQGFLSTPPLKISELFFVFVPNLEPTCTEMSGSPSVHHPAHQSGHLNNLYRSIIAQAKHGAGRDRWGKQQPATGEPVGQFNRPEKRPKKKTRAFACSFVGFGVMLLCPMPPPGLMTRMVLPMLTELVRPHISMLIFTGGTFPHSPYKH